jgi:hypothetical protein
MWRAAEPHPHDRACGSVGPHAPRDRLSQRASPGSVPAQPAVPVPVVEVARAQYRVRVGAGRALECRADSKRRRPVPGARPVDRAQEARFLTRDPRMADQGGRLRPRRRSQKRGPPYGQCEKCAASHHSADESARRVKRVLPKLEISRVISRISGPSAPTRSRRARLLRPRAEPGRAPRAATHRRSRCPRRARTSPGSRPESG